MQNPTQHCETAEYKDHSVIQLPHMQHRTSPCEVQSFYEAYQQHEVAATTAATTAIKQQQQPAMSRCLWLVWHMILSVYRRKQTMSATTQPCLQKSLDEQTHLILCKLLVPTHITQKRPVSHLHCQHGPATQSVIEHLKNMAEVLAAMTGQPPSVAALQYLLAVLHIPVSCRCSSCAPLAFIIPD